MDTTNQEYISTSNRNRISRKSRLCGTPNIHLHGKTVIKAGAVVRGDLANVRIGKSCMISEDCVIRPPFKRYKGGLAFFPLSIGDNTIVGRGSIVEATAIGTAVNIGENCIIGKRCILKDCCWIKENSVLAPDTIVPPFSIFEGAPAQLVGELPECIPEVLKSISNNVS